MDCHMNFKPQDCMLHMTRFMGHEMPHVLGFSQGQFHLDVAQVEYANNVMVKVAVP